MAEPAKTVYSYYSPEIRKTVQAALMGMNHAGPGAFPEGPGIHKLLQQNYDPGLDDLHLPLMERYEAFARSEGVIGLDTFRNKYFTNGSSEGIFHLLVQAKTEGEAVYVFEGEYQGYTQYAKDIGLEIQTLKTAAELSVPPGRFTHAEPGIVILSNPASKDGNILDPSVLRELLDYGHHVIWT
jgi:hypothetical protein